jgi:hypothetical protein
MPIVMNPISLIPKLRRAVEDHVPSDEPILWLEQPHPWAYLLGSIPTVLFGILWLSFYALFLPIMILQEKEKLLQNPLALIVLALFGFIGVKMAGAPFWDRWLARRTVYVITDRRAIIIEHRFRLRVFSYWLGELNVFERRPFGDGWGDLILERRITRDSDGMDVVFERGFLRIPDCKNVLNLLQDLKAKAESQIE